MSEHPEPETKTELVELRKAGDEFEARMILGLLEDHGIQAATTGEFSAGFRAEAPGVVRVHVAKHDFETAQHVLAQAKTSQPRDTVPDDPGSTSQWRTIAKLTATILVALLLLSCVTDVTAVFAEILRQLFAAERPSG